ncbi:MAG: hypothetical protein GX610_19330 [Rhodococcus sp.]|nr:hypothetical protein [Rhodococcus sp. (in: high G+C Gram-positive bacteria)]
MNVLLSPFDTAEMHCASWHGIAHISTSSMWGKKHSINMATVSLGSINQPLEF